MNETNLYRNNRKTIRLLTVSSIICVLLLIVLLYSIGLFDGIFKARPAVFSSLAMLILFVLLVVNLLDLRDKSAQIVLNRTHFVGKTTPLSKTFGAGDWQDGKGIDIQMVGGETMVIVTLANPAKYRDRLSSLLWKMAYQEESQELNIMYSVATIDLDAPELYKLFLFYWNESSQSPKE
ncbi:hypothetical protein [Sphingobacterium mizutaii]|uniref:hypothetical protein n=1 Tax=Sphingobacterium mizutaii TaxID=1010 RepID=UPI00162764F9|nr:hypothetical protein [Sphingobacterium mizutaii]